MIPSQINLEEICNSEFVKKGLDESLQSRLKDELNEVFNQAEEDYLLDLYEKKAKFPQNENNLLIGFLLGLVDEFDPKSPPVYMQGDPPDIDIDYIPVVRDYLKNDWAPKTFGRENVCAIGTYGTLGIKSALKDMTRVHGIPKDEIEIIAKGIPDKFSDDPDDKDISEWDMAIKICPGLKEYCEQYPDIAESVQVLLDRSKSGGVHAGGLIISSVPIADFVPLEVRSVKKENKYGIICSAWGEGLRTQDLGPVGLIKFDLLVVDDLRQIAYTCDLIRTRYGIDKICALPGGLNWSDTAYLNDPKALALANKGDTKSIFQFGSVGIRKLLQRGGVSRFDDLAAYSSVYRPGPMNCLPGDTQINIFEGKKALNSLNPQTDSISYVAGDGSIKQTKNYVVTKTGKKKVVKIKTKSGKIIFSSLDHKFLVNSRKYVEAKKLSPGVKLAVKIN